LIRTLSNSKRFSLLCAAAVAAVFVSGSGVAAPAQPTTEVVVTLKAPALSAFGRSLTSASHAAYAHELAAAESQAEHEVVAAFPGAQIRWRYRIVTDGFAVVLPRSEVGRLAELPGIAKVWPNVT